MIMVPICIGFLLVLTILLRYSEHSLYYILIPLVPFSQSIPVLSLGSRSVNLGMDTVLIAIIVLWHYLFKRHSVTGVFQHSKISTILILWLLWNLTTIVISSLYLKPNEVAENFFVFLRWTQYIPIFMILSNGKLSYKQTKVTVVLLVCSGVFAACLGLYQIYEGLDSLHFKGAPSFTVPLFREAEIAESTNDAGLYVGSANYNVVGAYLLIALLMLFPFVLSAKKYFYKIVGLLIVIVLIAGIIVTFSRISLIACVVALLIAMYCISRMTFVKGVLFISIILAVSFVFFSQFKAVSEIYELITKITDAIPLVLGGGGWSPSSDISASVFGAALRVAGARDAIIIFMDNPIIGYGFNAFQHYGLFFTPDNYYLQMAAETGLIGVLFFVLFMLELYKSIKLSGKYVANKFVVNYRIGLTATIVAMLIVNLTGNLFYIQKVWGPFLIVCGIWYSLRKEIVLDNKVAG